MVKRQWLVFSFYILCLVGLIIGIQPSLLHPFATRSADLSRTHERPLIHGEEFAEPLTETKFIYRENAQRTGVHANSFLPRQLHEVWHSPRINVGIHTASKSSPAVDETGVYVGSDSGWFYHFSITGEEIWRFRVDQARRGIHGSAALDQNYVYFGAYNGRFYCLKKSTGELVWQTQLMDAVGSSPILDGDSIYISSETAGRLDGYLFKLDRRTGSVIWNSTNFGEQIHSSPAIDGDGRVFLGANNGNFVAFSTSTGDVLWAKRVGGSIKSTPIVIGETVSFTSWQPALHTFDRKTGEAIGMVAMKGRSQSSPTFAPDRGILLMGSHGVAEIFGVRLESEPRNVRLANVSTSQSELPKAMPASGSLTTKWQTAIHETHGGVLGSGVAVRESEKSAYIVWIGCGDARLCAIDPQDGSTLSFLKLRGRITSVPAIAEGHLFVSLDRGPLVMYGAEDQSR